MKSFFSNQFINKTSLILLSLFSFSLTSCLDKEGEAPEPTPVAYVTLYHGAPDAPEFDILVDNQRLNSQPFKYNNYSDYLRFSTGSRKFKFTPVNAANSYVDTTLTFKENKLYSVFAVNRLQDMEVLVVSDTVMTPAAGKAGMRIIHLSPDAPAVDVATTGTTGTSITTNLNFKEHTLFKDVATGNQTIQIKRTGTNEVLLTLSDVALTAGKSYSLLLRGFQTPPTGNTNILSGQVVTNY
ncbi:hypothetical protein AAE02nite_42370 [Adhaeribacter aerolatus]|uniref:DUF4397 domain-containing protein n=1 Tax=Adhaeribacter aerolatus TaxID=670289 RepID=A0A512B3N4_9BACT|nr:DUF4397 domain-containing protein [Adhaeribacter aerolatus]GEO06573.1 hypothetical protein AAE02nite_42370 [Adhaeribacter aerolatus]